VPPRRERIPVVLDTNVIIAYYLSTSGRSASRRIFHLWRDIRRLQLIVSREVQDEYVEVLRRVNVAENRLGNRGSIGDSCNSRRIARITYTSPPPLIRQH